MEDESDGTNEVDESDGTDEVDESDIIIIVFHKILKFIKTHFGEF